ncbi:adhesion G-protein coupled receptor G1-like [Archocentrus centrarchus]|uniref:adhesion G-protein coupled receptor G1-like n=1 Tax=Archocentrus centrarchus TaxID=63155 RepID=UPI0011EA4114|nr:adhesion G-protein coupled receptor G1-like [Archocentrus centrarchus]
MWIRLFIITIISFSASQAGECENILSACRQHDLPWTRCYEEKTATCELRSRLSGFSRRHVNASQEVEMNPTHQHRAHIPSSALQRAVSTVEVQVVASVISSTYFKLSPPPKNRLKQIHRREGSVLGELVLAVKAGNISVRNLTEPIKLIFIHNKEINNGTCVFWEESAMENETGYWSSEGCRTNKTGQEFICSCDHLSFFAVLVNPDISVQTTDAGKLGYITYIGSALSVFFTFISLIIFICLCRRRPEKAVGLHMQLTGAMLCLHLTFLLCSFWAWLLQENEDSSVCLVLGLLLHWSLLATLTWTALEGFQIYFLLVRVFNIYIRRYLLKLSLVGWGFPTLIAAICGISGVYGKYTLQLRDAKNSNSTAHICWMSSKFPQKHLLTSYITTVAFPFLVVVFNGCMLGLVVFKMWTIRKDDRDFGSNSDWKNINKEKRKRLWKDSVTVLGLSCVLGLPWGLASTTYISLAGIYVFTIFNSLQGVFVFLWSVAFARKS